jgi:diguanylate cyclase (GGDEF)-like protein/PAS domain S-box-containing protein
LPDTASNRRQGRARALGFEHAAAAIVVYDADGRILDLNPEAERITGAPRSALIGASLDARACAFVRPDGTAMPVDEVPSAVALRTGVPQSNVVVGIDHPTEGRRWLRVSARRDVDPRTGAVTAIASFVDVTRERARERLADAARDRAERALAELDAYKTAIDQHGMVLATDPVGTITFVNDALCRRGGWTRAELVGRPASVLVAGEADAAVLAELLSTVRAGGIWKGEIRQRARDGSSFWTETTVVPRRGDDGAVDSFVAIQHDVTERRRAREALGASEAKFRTLFEVAPIGIARHRRSDGVLLDANPALAALAGLSQNGLADDPASAVGAGLPALGAAGAFGPTEAAVRRPDGVAIPVLVSGVVAPGEDATDTVWSFVQDVSTVKAAEDAAVETARRLEAVILATGVGTWEWEVETGRMGVDRRWAEMVGLDVDDLSAIDGDTWRGLVHPDDLLACREAYRRTLEGTAPVYAADIRMRHRDGRWIWVHTRGAIVRRTDDGRPLLMVGTHQDITERRHAEEALRSTNARIQAVIDNFPGGITVVDGDLQMLSCNAGYRRLLDLPDSLFEGGMPNLVDIFRFNAARGEFGPGDPETIVESLVAPTRRPKPHVFERTRPNGVTIEIRGMPVPGGGFVTTYADVSDRRRAQDIILEKSRIAERRTEELQITLAHMNQGLSVFDRDGRLAIWNQRYVDLFGLDAAEVTAGVPLAQLLRRQRDDGGFTGDPDAYVAAIRAATGRGEEYRATTTRADGRVIATVHSPTPEGGWVATHDDVTDAVRAAERIAFAAHHDILTSLTNRAGLKARLRAALDAVTPNGPAFSVLLIDLDRFKAVNDTFGHATGDRLLQAVAERMRANVRPCDLVARLGGDEFAVYFAAGSDQREASVVLATRLLAAVGAPYDIDGRQIYVGASIGVAIAPDHGATVDELMRNADSALYEVKAAGRNGMRIFDDRLALAARERRELESDLRDALALGQFELHYQPVVSVADRRIVALEALLRWRHPRRGLVQPDVFVPIAEQTGLIGPIGRWVIATACNDAARWPDDIAVAVNVSPAQLGRHDLVDVVTRELLRSRLSPRRLELEVTETVLLGNDDGVLGELHQLRSLDVRIALDDFGTGFSSLSYLRLFPFDRIKIDRSFVRDLESSTHSAAIVCAVAGLAASLGIETTAEGVETEEQARLLAAAGCTAIQGYLHGRPRPLAEIDLSEPSRGHDRRLSA